MFQQDADYLSLCALQLLSPRVQNMNIGAKKCRLNNSSRHQHVMKTTLLLSALLWRLP